MAPDNHQHGLACFSMPPRQGDDAHCHADEDIAELLRS
jgi:hypothetical protein